MTIYTKAGDEGFTHRPGGRRVRKCDPLVDAVGEIDELNASIGWCLPAAGDDRQAEVRESLQPLQPELLAAGALLAAAGTDAPPGVKLDETAVTRMERQIDAAWDKLPDLRHFIVPGGCELACRLQICRTVCRRAERSLTAAAKTEAAIPAIVFTYLNRLSDLLFALGRLANHNEGRAEIVWER